MYNRELQAGRIFFCNLICRTCDARDACILVERGLAFKKNLAYSNKKVALAKTRRILRLKSHHAPGADPRYIRQNIAFEVPAGLCRS